MSLLLCTHFIKLQFNVGYCYIHFAFNINHVAIRYQSSDLVAIVTMIYLLCNGPLLHNITHMGKVRIVTCNYVVLSQVNLPVPDTIFPLRNFEIQSRLDTKHQLREDPRQMQQFSQRPWQSLMAHQGATAPSLGTANLKELF